MSLRNFFAVCLASVVLAAASATAEEPPDVYATDREKLDYLFSSWRGQTEEALRAVWGRPESLQERTSSKTFQFERAKRGPAIGIGGIRVVGRGVVTCRAYFQTALEGVVTRATWRGPDANACWDLFRESAPPAADAESSGAEE